MFIPIGVDEPVHRRPIVTIVIIVLDVFIWMYVGAHPDGQDIKVRWSLIPGLLDLSGAVGHLFIHSDFWHLAGNMLFFFVAARKIEDVLGPWKFLSFYFAAGIASAAFDISIQGQLPIPGMGASGAISGVMGALMFLYPRSRVRMVIFPIPFVFHPRIWFIVGLWFLAQLASGIISKQVGGIGGIAFFAHIGGFVYGAFTMAGFFGWDQGLGAELRSRARQYYTPKEKRRSTTRRRLGEFMAWGLQGAALLFLLAAWLDGGFRHPYRPETREESMMMVANRVAARQDADSLFDEASKRGEAASVLDQAQVEKFRQRLDEDIIGMVEMHKDLRYGARPPHGMIADWDRFLAEELPSIPPKSRISLEEVEAISVIYTPGEFYQIFCGTDMKTDEAMKAYFDIIDKRDWAVVHPIYDPVRDAGSIESFSGRWELRIIIAPNASPISSQKTMVIWHLQKMK